MRKKLILQNRKGYAAFLSMNHFNATTGPIGVFDSGFGGLSILREIRRVLPQYDYLFLGDNARAPYGSRSFALVYEFTLQAVKYLFNQGCQLVILACNTASAKALRTIQQCDLPQIDPTRRVLGVIRPTVEAVGQRHTHRPCGRVWHAGNHSKPVLQHRNRSSASSIQSVWPCMPHVGATGGKP